jgi:uncharacterized protein YndB with AHSA1/START domain
MAEGVAAREVTITRVFDAPRGLVWKEWTEPERLARWWGPRGWNTSVEGIEMDVRPGGALRVISVSDEDGAEMATEGVYREVVEPARLVFEEAAEGAWHEGAVTTVTFADLGDGKTKMVFRSTIRTTAEGLDTAAAGLSGAFDRLATRLAR